MKRTDELFEIISDAPADPMKDADPSGKRSSGRRTQEKTGPGTEKQLTNPSKKDIIKDTDND